MWGWKAAGLESVCIVFRCREGVWGDFCWQVGALYVFTYRSSLFRNYSLSHSFTGHHLEGLRGLGCLVLFDLLNWIEEAILRIPWKDKFCRTDTLTVILTQASLVPRTLPAFPFAWNNKKLGVAWDAKQLERKAGSGLGTSLKSSVDRTLLLIH